MFNSLNKSFYGRNKELFFIVLNDKEILSGILHYIGYCTNGFITVIGGIAYDGLVVEAFLRSWKHFFWKVSVATYKSQSFVRTDIFEFNNEFLTVQFASFGKKKWNQLLVKFQEY